MRKKNYWKNYYKNNRERILENKRKRLLKKKEENKPFSCRNRGIDDNNIIKKEILNKKLSLDDVKWKMFQNKRLLAEVELNQEDIFSYKIKILKLQYIISFLILFNALYFSTLIIIFKSVFNIFYIFLLVGIFLILLLVIFELIYFFRIKKIRKETYKIFNKISLNLNDAQIFLDKNNRRSNK